MPRMGIEWGRSGTSPPLLFLLLLPSCACWNLLCGTATMSHTPSSEASRGFTTSLAGAGLSPPPKLSPQLSGNTRVLCSDRDSAWAQTHPGQQEAERDNIWFEFFFITLLTEYFLFSLPRTSFISPCLPLATVSGRNNEFLIGGGGGKKQNLRQGEKTLIC